MALLLFVTVNRRLAALAGAAVITPADSAQAVTPTTARIRL
ncbi:MAG TPA: hypothetical protein VFT68_12980 [Lapillicoccus sp.]|nr:hypothetical protein [Lapillicoccus sp.]